MTHGLLGIAVVALSICTSLGAASRFEEFTQKFAHTTDRAEVVASTFLGSSGTEWLAAGGFQADGTVVAAGVTLGPALDLGTSALVLGADGPISAPARRPLLRSRRPELDKSGQPKMEPLTWLHPNATAFIVRLAADLKTIKSVTRLGWKAGGLTDAQVDNEGNIYICGPATAGITNISDDAVQASITSPNEVMNPSRCSHVYLAKVSADGTKALWVRSVIGSSPAPKLQLEKTGNIVLQGADVRVFDPAGKLITQAKIPTDVEGQLAVNPMDRTCAIAGEHHWPTGREPFRDPILNIYKPDGSLLYELYNWDGPFVGLNDLRLVSDSAIRGVTYDDEGNLLLHAWSDGGNSVMYREPTDIYTQPKHMDGLGLSASGAGILSCAYVIKLAPRTYNVAAGTLWVGYLSDRNKPNSVTINSLGAARDGSVCIGGNAAWGLIQTGNAFGGDPTGNYVAIMSKDLTSLRFSSVMPATGQIDIGANMHWGINSGTVRGKTLALFVSGAVERDGTRTPPLLNARQEKYAGGFSDGHLLLLDLSPAKGL